MTKLLEKAFRGDSRLPAADQNALAKWVIEELHAEKVWGKSFAESEEFLEKLADEAISEKRKGRTVPLDINRLCNTSR